MPANSAVVREGLYTISWRASQDERVQARMVTLKLAPQLLCTLSCNLDGDGVLHLMVKLEVTATGGIPLMLTSTPTIYATKDIVRQKMVPSEKPGAVDTWEASWVEGQRCDYCHRNRPCTFCGVSRPLASFEVLIDIGKPEKMDQEAPIKPGQKLLISNMEKLLSDSSMADVTFKFPNNYELKAHSAILSAGSPVLAACLRHDLFEDSRSRVIEVKDIEPEVFLQLLHYIYTGSTGKANNNNSADDLTEELLSAADRYQIDLLKEECTSALVKKLRVDNVVRILVLAHLHSCQDLLQKTLDYICKNAKEISSRPDWYELMEKYPKLCFNATQMMWSSSRNSI